MPFDPQQKSTRTLALFASEPSIDLLQLSEELECQLSYLLILADESWLYRIETSLGISRVLIVKSLQFLGMLIEESIEQNY